MDVNNSLLVQTVNTTQVIKRVKIVTRVAPNAKFWQADAYNANGDLTYLQAIVISGVD